MKKLKAVLVLLFALVMSLALFACGGGGEEDQGGSENPSGQNPSGGGGQNPPGGGGEENPPGGGGEEKPPVVTVDDPLVDEIEDVEGIDDLTLTDSQGEADWKALTDEIVVTYYNMDDDDNYPVTVKEGKVTVDANIKFGTVGRYTVTITPLKDTSANPDNESVKTTLTIVHDWQEEDGATVCAHDRALLTTQEEDLVAHFGPFHSGIGNFNVPTSWTDADGGTHETGYNDVDAGKNYKIGEGSKFETFGTVSRNGQSYNVPTFSAGKLEKGMTITVRGKAHTAFTEWGVADAGYYFPILGIADRYAVNANPNAPVDGGVSVFVRQEGWVLYNGIDGVGGTRVLNSLVGGSTGTVSESYAPFVNYASLSGDSNAVNKPCADYTPRAKGEDLPDPNSAAWQNWWVFSDGEAHPSTSWTDEGGTPVELSWVYREDGVIELHNVLYYDDPNLTSELVSYIKVPDSSTGYYDAILHGDYADVYITEREEIVSFTPTDFRYTNVDANGTLYREGQKLDATTIHAQMKYKQTGDVWQNLSVSANQVYYYTGTATDKAGVTADIDAADKWALVGDNALRSSMKFFKIEVEKVGRTFNALIDATITVVPNLVESAAGANATVDGQSFENARLGTFTVSHDANAVTLTLDDYATAHALSTEQIAKISGATATMKYVSILLSGYEWAADETNGWKTALTVTNGKAVAVAAGSDLYLVVAVEKGTKTVEITGLMGTKLVIDFADKLVGFDVAVNITNETTLNAGGNVTLEYTFDGDVPADYSVKLTDCDELNKGGLDYYTGKDGQGGEEVSIGKGIFVTDYTVSGSKLTIKLGFPAANLDALAPITATLTANGSVRTVNDIYYNLEIGTLANTYAQGDVAISASGTELTVVKVIKDTSLEAADLVVNGLILSVNHGEVATAGVLDLAAEYKNGEFVLVSPSAGVSVKLVLDGSLDGVANDHGAVIVYTIDMTKYGIESAATAYGFEVLESVTAGAAPTKYYAVADGKITEKTISTSGLALETLREGTCLEEGLYAYVVKEGDAVVYLAGVFTAGGDHVDVKGGGDEGNEPDSHCDLCGGTMTKNTAISASANWFPKGHPNIQINEGDIITFTGKYSEDIAEGGFGSVLAVMVEERDGEGWDAAGNDEHTQGTWHTTQDGYAIWTNFSWSADNRFPYAPDATGYEHAEDGYQRFTSSLITEDHPYNTANGWINAYGDEVTEASFGAAKLGGTFRFIVTRVNGVITVKAQLWSKDMTAFHSAPFFEYETTTQVDPAAGKYMVMLFGKQQNNNKVELQDGVTVTTSKVVNTVVSGVEGAAIDSHAATDMQNLHYTAKSEGAYAVLAFDGEPSKDGENYYLALKINFSQALVDSTSVRLLNGTAELTGGKVELAADKMSVSVYVPFKIGDNIVPVIDFNNHEASSKQSDIKLDLSDVVVGNTVGTASGEAELKISGGTFTIAYTNVRDTDTVVIGETSKTIAELKAANAQAPVELASGISAYATVEGTTATVHYVVAAYDITKALSSVEIRLERGGMLLTRYTHAPAVAIDTTGLQEIAGTGWFVSVSGTQLVLFTNGDAGELPFNVNAGKATELTSLGVHELGFSIDHNAVKFTDNNILTRAATTFYTVNGDAHLTVIVLDLAKVTGLGVEATTPYGFAIEKSDFNKYYTVDADRKIAEATVGNGEKTEVVAADCINDGLKANKSVDTFYYGFETVAASGHHEYVLEEEPSAELLAGYDKVYTCSVCGAHKYTQSELTQTWGSGEADAYAGWGSFGWEKFAEIQKGGKYTVTGTNLSNKDHIWDMPEPGLTGVVADGYDGYRIDNFNQDDNSKQSLNATFSHKNNKTDESGDWTVAAKALSDGSNIANTLADGFVGLDGVTITYTFDYTDITKIVITMHFVKGDTLDLTSTVTLTGDLADVYHLAFHQDGNKFSASSCEVEVPKNGTVTAPLSKHVHGNWNAQDRCPDDGVLNPEHEHNFNLGEDKVASGTLYCRCGALNPEHTHAYENGSCKYCKAVGTTGLEAAGFTASTYTSGALENDNFNLGQPASAEAAIEVGQTLILIGTIAAPNIAVNWDTLSWEIEEGWTERGDDFGWAFADSGITKETKLLAIYDKSGEAVTFDWSVMQSIAKAASYKIEIKFVSATKIEGTVTLTATDGDHVGYSYVNTVELTSPKDLTAVHTHLGMRNGTISLLGYKIV